MFQIIDSFDILNKEDSTDQNPLSNMDRGTWFILNSDEREKVDQVLPDQIAKITKPDGGVQVLKITNVQTRHTILAVQFEKTVKIDLPRLSKVELQSDAFPL